MPDPQRQKEVDKVDYNYIGLFRYLLDLAIGVAPAPGRLRVANPTHLDTPRLVWLDACVCGRNRNDRKATLRSRRHVEHLITDEDVSTNGSTPSGQAETRAQTATARYISRDMSRDILSVALEPHRVWLDSLLRFSHRLTFAQRLDQLIDHAAQRSIRLLVIGRNG